MASFFFVSFLSVLKLTEPKDSGIKNNYKDNKTTANKQEKRRSQNYGCHREAKQCRLTLRRVKAVHFCEG